MADKENNKSRIVVPQTKKDAAIRMQNTFARTARYIRKEAGGNTVSSDYLEQIFRVKVNTDCPVDDAVFKNYLENEKLKRQLTRQKQLTTMAKNERDGGKDTVVIDGGFPGADIMEKQNEELATTIQKLRDKVQVLEQET